MRLTSQHCAFPAASASQPKRQFIASVSTITPSLALMHIIVARKLAWRRTFKASRAHFTQRQSCTYDFSSAGVNPQSHLTLAERRARNGWRPNAGHSAGTAAPVSDGDAALRGRAAPAVTPTSLPSSKTWVGTGLVTPVRDQVWKHSVAEPHCCDPHHACCPLCRPTAARAGPSLRPAPWRAFTFCRRAGRSGSPRSRCGERRAGAERSTPHCLPPPLFFPAAARGLRLQHGRRQLGLQRRQPGLGDGVGPAQRRCVRLSAQQGEQSCSLTPCLPPLLPPP